MNDLTIPAHQKAFDGLLDYYNSGNEPLENWSTDDLIKLIDAADRELQNRSNEPTAESDDFTFIEEYDGENDVPLTFMGQEIDLSGAVDRYYENEYMRRDDPTLEQYDDE